MRDGCDYRTLDELFPFLAEFSVRPTGMVESILTNSVHSMSAKLLLYVTKIGSERTSWRKYVPHPRCGISELQKLISNIIETHSEKRF